MTLDITHFKNRLETEKEKLEKELRTVAEKGERGGEDWSAHQTQTEDDRGDRAEVADAITNYEENVALTSDLETQLVEVDRALEKINKGTYGLCEISGEPIEKDRLDANPSARTCKTHINEVLS